MARVLNATVLRLCYTRDDPQGRCVFKPEGEERIHGCSVLVQRTYVERFLRGADVSNARVTLVVEQGGLLAVTREKKLENPTRRRRRCRLA